MRPVSSFCVVTVYVLFAMLAQAAPIKLRCDYRENPLGIDERRYSRAGVRDWRGRSAEQAGMAGGLFSADRFADEYSPGMVFR